MRKFTKLLHETRVKIRLLPPVHCANIDQLKECTEVPSTMCKHNTPQCSQSHVNSAHSNSNMRLDSMIQGHPR